MNTATGDPTLRRIQTGAGKGVEPPATVPDDRIGNDGNDNGEFGRVERAIERLVVRLGEDFGSTTQNRKPRTASTRISMKRWGADRMLRHRGRPRLVG